MSQSRYLLDTHSLIFWVDQTLSAEFITFLNSQNQSSRLFVTTISFWEIAMLSQKGRVEISDPYKWRDELLALSGIRVLDPTATEMIDSAMLPRHHGDPFDRLMIAQAIAHDMTLVSRDGAFKQYDVPLLWM